tara:strand:- start:1317 stop:1781 length:465 start_codon:yes stop_codon:yes gene_type:complete
MKLYEFRVKDIDGSEVDLSSYKGKVILIVNVASACGFTPQYEGLQDLFERYKDKGLEILAFPCNQFGSQEPGSNEQIKTFCEDKYSVSFKLFDKVDVIGEHASPLFNYLNEVAGRDIKWNFTKFLFDQNGNFIKGFGSMKTPKMIEENIIELVN